MAIVKRQRYRYTVECGSPEGKLVWWHDDDACFETMPIASQFVDLMRQKFGSAVQVHHVTREEINSDRPPPQTDEANRVFVFAQTEVGLKLPAANARLLPGR